jgi:hypothetical protein
VSRPSKAYTISIAVSSITVDGACISYQLWSAYSIVLIALDVGGARYIEHHRKMLDPFEMAGNSVWVSSRAARPMSYPGIERVITDTTASTIGIALSPHLFRTSAATTAATNAGGMPGLASALLDHRDSQTTEQHYNRATTLSAGKAYLKVPQTYRD